MKKLFVILFAIAVNLHADYVIEKFTNINVVMFCIEDRVYADLGEVLSKIVWKVNGKIEHLECKNYENWRNDEN